MPLITDITGTKADNLDPLVGSIPDTQLIIVPDPVSGKLLRSTFGQMKADIVLELGDLSYLDDIIEVPTIAELPQPGQTQKIYVITTGDDANKQFRWGGSMYIEFPQGSGDVAGEAIIRGNADANLQAQIDGLEENVLGIDTNIDAKILVETNARTNADTNLSNRINSEINARQNAGSTLQGLITSEGTIRAQQDNLLSDRIDAVTAQLSPEKFTTEEKNKLAGLESSKYRGLFINKTALDAADVGGEGNYADVDAGTGADVSRWIWDSSDNKWVLQEGESTAETAASIKAKYESNPDTNAYTDAEKAKLATLENYDGTAIEAALANKVDKIPDMGLSSNDFTDEEKTKLDSLTPQTGKYLISGGFIPTGAGLTYQGSVLNYFFNGKKTAAPTTKTLAASDPTNDRIDAFVVDELGVVTVITGIPSENPVTPVIEDDQLLVQYVIVAAGSVTPPAVQENIYLDNAEWAGSNYTTSGTQVGVTNFAGTNAPKQGTYCIENSLDGRTGIKLTRAGMLDITTFSTLSGWFRFSAAQSNKMKMNLRFENRTDQVVGNELDLFQYGLDKNLPGVWQFIVINISAFNVTSVQALRMILTGGANGTQIAWDVDQLVLNDGSTPVVNTNGITFYKDGTRIGNQPAVDLLQGTGMNITAVEDPITKKVKYTLSATATGDVTKAYVDAADQALSDELATKLNAADYNQHFKGKFTSLANLQAAIPVAADGDYAQVDAGAGSDVINYNWDNEDGWIEGGSGSAATTTDQLPEGSSNLYFTAARAQAVISGTTNRIAVTAGIIDIAATYAGQSSITTVGTIAAGSWQATAIDATHGGTSQTSWAKGDILYASAIDTLSRLSAGADGYVLTMASGLPVWAAASAGGGGIYPGTGAAFTSYAKGDLIYASEVNVLSKLPVDTDGKVLTLVSGVPAWSAATVNWSRSGNAGTVAGTDFLGTTDDVDLVFKRNNIQQFVLGFQNVYVGYLAGSGAGTVSSAVFFGNQAGKNASGASASNFLGTSAGNGATNAYNSNFFGNVAGLSATNANSSNFFGSNAGNTASGASASNFFGASAGNGATNASNSNFFGASAGQAATGATYSNFLGTSAGQSASNAPYSNFFGRQAGYLATNAGFSNFLGQYAGNGATGASYSNFIGFRTGYSATFVITGTNNIVIGTNITTPAAASTNTFNFGNVLYGVNCYGTTSGNPSAIAQTTGRVSIGTTSADASAILDLTSTTMGFLPPRMSTTNADAIASKAEALFLYDNTLKKYKFWNGTAFEIISSS